MTEKRVLVLGQAPAKTGGGEPLMSYRRGGRLRVLSPEQTPDNFVFANILNYYPGGNGKGDKFPISEAKEAVNELNLSKYDAIVAIGKTVARALGVKNLEYFQSEMIGGALIHVFPHPSGVNRWWNAEGTQERADDYLNSLRERYVT